MNAQNTTANALYVDADGTHSLVVLDEADCLLTTVQADLSDAEVDAIFAGDTEHRASARAVEVGDGDAFYRLTLR